jgi:hypothetical protein
MADGEPEIRLGGLIWFELDGATQEADAVIDLVAPD